MSNKENEIASSHQRLSSTESQLQASLQDLQALTQEYSAAQEGWQHESKRHAEELEAVKLQQQQAEGSWKTCAARIKEEKEALEAEMVRVRQAMADEQASESANARARDEEYQADLRMLRAEAEDHVQERSALQQQFDAAVAALKDKLEVQTAS